MFPPAIHYTAFVALLLGMLPGGPVCPAFLQAATLSTSGQAPVGGKRLVAFDFAGLDASGDISLVKPFKLSLTLNGMMQGHVPVVAVCESIHFERQIVTMEPDPLSRGLHATVILEPIAPGKLSVPPKFARIHVTFARAHTEKKLERVMTRIVYVTLGQQDASNTAADLPPPSLDDIGGEEALVEGLLPESLPIADEVLVEENLLPLPEPGRGKAYWQEVSSLLSRSWNRTARRVRHAPSSETVRVRFRMYPNGRAQLIEIEQGSGSREIDEAGIHAVALVQPFPPFPEEMDSEPIEVHVRMRTGTQRGERDIQPVAHSQPLRTTTPAPTPKP